jgi:basic membrane protein A and related proteins
VNRLSRGGLMALLGLAGLAAGCRSKGPAVADPPAVPAPAPVAPPVEDRRLVVAFLYAGPKDDGGFNSAHAAAVRALGRLSDVRVVEEENVPEDSGARLLMEKAVVLREARLVFSTGFGHFDPSMLEQAVAHPKVTFLHCGGYYQEGKHPANAGSYHGFLDEAFYVSGVVAASTSKTRKLGFVAAKALPHVLRDLNAFALGARSVDARITTTVVFTGSWSDPLAEGRAVERLADQKIDVVAGYVQSPRVLLEAAERRGLYSVGVHVDGRRWAPRGYLTGAEWSWEDLYKHYVGRALKGEDFPRFRRGGLGDGLVTISPFGPAVPEATQKRALDVRERLAQGTLVVWKGPLKDNQGRLVIAAGKQLLARDIELERMGYLVEGVIGTLPE